jgi:hypothetical protein
MSLFFLGVFRNTTTVYLTTTRAMNTMMVLEKTMDAISLGFLVLFHYHQAKAFSSYMQDVNEGEYQELEGVLEDRHQEEVVAEEGLVGEEPQPEGPKQNQKGGDLPMHPRHDVVQEEVEQSIRKG